MGHQNSRHPSHEVLWDEKLMTKDLQQYGALYSWDLVRTRLSMSSDHNSRPPKYLSKCMGINTTGFLISLDLQICNRSCWYCGTSWGWSWRSDEVTTESENWATYWKHGSKEFIFQFFFLYIINHDFIKLLSIKRFLNFFRLFHWIWKLSDIFKSHKRLINTSWNVETSRLPPAGDVR